MGAAVRLREMAAPLIPDCTGVLIAGGRARRMGGVPKGLLRVGREPIAARSLSLFRKLFGATLIVANDPRPYAELGAPIVPDIHRDRGAPGGLHAALARAETEWVFAAGCDMPFLEARAISFLAARRGCADAVLVRFAGHLEPLHAFYAKRSLSVLARLLARGEPSLRDLAAATGARIVEEDEWREIDPTGRVFENANTPGDAARLGLRAPGPKPGTGGPAGAGGRSRPARRRR
jgi:molybdenum cofactor guanylyltransferase